MALVTRRFSIVGPTNAMLAQYVDPASSVAVMYPLATIDITIDNDPNTLATLDAYMTSLGFMVDNTANAGVTALAVTIQAAACNAPSSKYPTSGLIITPFPQAGTSILGVPTDSIIQFQFDASLTGNVELVFDYAMSSANAGTVVVNLIVFQCATGDDPNGAPTAFSGLSFTPGSSLLVKKLDSSVLAQLKIPVTRGQTTYLSFSRPIAGGTHPGDFNIINWNIRPL